MLYNYLITAYKVIAGLVTPERLMAVALGAFGLFILWICIALFSSFQRKFNTRCQSLINFVIKTKDIDKTPERINEKADKVSSGFGFGWKKFNSAAAGKPSDFIRRRESLDVEINGGLLNNGKTMMRAYITFFTVILFIFNFVYVGGENTITFMTFAESLILPLVFYVISKLFYFLHNSIKQKLYRMDIESFYELIDLLDTKFAKKGNVVFEEASEDEKTDEENAEEKQDEEQAESTEEEPTEEKQEEDEGLDKYDVFKKKNIDVKQLMNETPKGDTTLPFINVDSDYVIKDDDQPGAKQVSQGDNMSTLFDGMMQNTSGSKKNTYVDIEKNIAEIDEEKLEKLENKDLANEATEVSEEEKPAEEKNVVETDVNNEIDVDSQSSDDDLTSTNSSKFIEIEKNEKPNQVINDDQALEEANIANVVSGFKANRSKLASGGMVIERNEPIVKRDRTGFFTEQDEQDDAVDDPISEEPIRSYSESEEPSITRPVADENADTILNTLKSVPGNYEGYPQNQTFAPSTTYGSMGYDQGYGYNAQPMYSGQMNPQMQGYGYVPEQPVYPGYAQSNYNSSYQGVNQNRGYVNPNTIEEDDEEEAVETPKKKKVVRTKENEPRPRNLKSSASAKKPAKSEDTEMAKRGRPKKQEFNETMIIENDKQFNEALSRAEKLMRKSDEGLSESQSKRIEKEIKVLMDAMNKYKESK